MFELLALISTDPLDLIPDRQYPAYDNAIYRYAHPTTLFPVLKNPYILRDKEYKLSVFIYGYEKEKVERIMGLKNMSESETLKYIKEMDKRRSINYKYYTDNDWGYRGNYDLLLNSSTLGYDRVVDIICDTVKTKFDF